MRIDSLNPQPDRAGRYRVQFSDGSVLRLYRQTVEDFGLFAGMELTQQEYEKLSAAAGEMSAKMRAVRIVSASSVSCRDLEHRLVQKGEDPQQAKQAVQWMADMDLLDDRKTAQQVVSRCAAKGYGMARAKQALYEKRIPKVFWEDALADYPDQSDAISSFLLAHLDANSDQKLIKKTVDALLRRGHSYGAVRRVLSTLDFDTDSLPEG